MPFRVTSFFYIKPNLIQFERVMSPEAIKIV